jgi:dsDNA-binding SOS-regulon protein
MSFLLSMQLAARDETKRGKAEASAPKMELPASTLSSSVHKNEVRQERSDGSKAPSRSNPEFAKGIEQLSSKEQVQAIQKDLLPIFLAIETKSSDWQVQVDPISREILQKPQYTVEDKQRAFLSLFLLVQKGNLSQMSNGGSPVVQSVSDRGVLSNDAKANGQTVAPIAISEEAHASVQKTAFTPFAKDETDRFPIDVSVKRETEAFVFVASSPETTSLLLPYIPVIDRAIEQAASTVVQHLAPQTKGALQQLPLFSAAKHAIRSIVEPVVFKAVQEQAKQKESPIVVGQVQATLQPSQKEDFTSLVEQVATRSAEQTAVVLIGAGLALTRSQDETTSIAKGKTVEEGSLPTTATSLSNNPSFFATKPVVEQKTESVQVAPQSVQGMLSLADQVIGSGTYSQLAVEGAFSTVVRSAGILQQLLTVKSFAETDLLTDAIPEIGTGRSGTNSINPLASEVVKEQKQTIGTGDSESAQTAEEEPRVAPNSYHQILAV